MPEKTQSEYRITWTGDALDVLARLLSATRHAETNLAWVERKFGECVLEGIRRLEIFPDLRVRYMVDGLKCGAMTLRTLPLQIFYRRIALDEITIFALRWASLDSAGPQEFDRP